MVVTDFDHLCFPPRQLFELSTAAKLGEADATTAIWDGNEFVLDDLSGNWWSSAKIFWRYGYSPITVNSVVNDLKAKFAQLYDPRFLHDTEGRRNSTKSGYPWDTIESLARKLSFSEPAATDADTWFYGKGVSRLFIREVIEAATRVNYAQNTDQIHALGAGVSLSASGAAGIKGGNYRVFEEMLKRSGATLHSGSAGEVTGMVKFRTRDEALAAGKPLQPSEFQTAGPKWWVGTAAGTGGLYDAVFVAAPWNSAGITLMNTESVIPVNKYVHLYVTLVATNASHPDPTYFNRGKGSTVAKTIMTTWNAVRKSQHRGGGGDDDGDNDSAHVAVKQASRLAMQQTGWWYDLTHLLSRPSKHSHSHYGSSTASVREPEFLSLNYISNLGPRRGGDAGSSPPSVNAPDDHLVKIFSLAPLSDGKLASILGDKTIAWTYRQQWESYPELHPTRDFPPIRPDQGIYYINAFEPLVSTMETSTVASRNAVALMLEQWYGLDFVTGKQCQFQAYTQDDDAREGWDGWGCNAA